MRKLSFEKDEQGKYHVAYFDGDSSGPIPPFATAKDDPHTRWCLFNGRELAGLGTMAFEEGFDTLAEVREHFRENGKLYRASVPPGTTGP